MKNRLACLCIVTVVEMYRHERGRQSSDARNSASPAIDWRSTGREGDGARL